MLQVTCIIPTSLQKGIQKNLTKCINSITASADGNAKTKVVLVTNSAETLDSELENKIDLLITRVGEFNFADMNNRAITDSLKNFNSDYYLLINDDAYISKSFFRIFKKIVMANKHDLLSPIVYCIGVRKIDSFGIEYFNSGYAKNSHAKKINTSLATASCVLIKTSFLNKIKKTFGFYFNPLLKSYYEDVEFSIRAKCIGGRFLKDDKLVAYHIGSKSSGSNSRYVYFQSMRNMVWVIIMSWPGAYILKNLHAITVVQVWFLLLTFKKFGPFYTIKLLVENIQNIMSLIKMRRTIIGHYSKDFKFGSLFNGSIFEKNNP